MINTLHQDDKNNRLNISEFQKFEGITEFNQVAAKLVINGEETYHIKGKKYVLKKGDYIIGNSNVLSEVTMTQRTMGLCVDISNDLITDIASIYFEQKDILNFIIGDEFLINKYRTENTSLGIELKSLSEHILGQKNSLHSNLFNQELFLSLAECIVMDQSKVFSEISKLTFKKQVVNEDNYRKLFSTREYIDDCFLDEIDVDTLAQIACMSKYNFIRLFKLTFGLSPYQYILTNRLHFARQELLNGKKVSDLAFMTGFSDTAAFSKAFKAQFSVAPSKLT